MAVGDQEGDRWDQQGPDWRTYGRLADRARSLLRGGHHTNLTKRWHEQARRA
jgi:hypothetical protein